MTIQEFTAFLPSQGVKNPVWREALIKVGYGAFRSEAEPRMMMQIHGLGDDATNFCSVFGQPDASEVRVCPNGLSSSAPRAFDAGTCCTAFRVDESSFLNQLSDLVEEFVFKRHGEHFWAGDRGVVPGNQIGKSPLDLKTPVGLTVDPNYSASVASMQLQKTGFKSINVGGFSNGAMLSELWSCSRPDLLDSVVSYSGTLATKPGNDHSLANCEALTNERNRAVLSQQIVNRRRSVESLHTPRGINYLHIHGTGDWKVPFTGRELVVKFAPIDKLLLNWGSRNSLNKLADPSSSSSCSPAVKEMSKNVKRYIYDCMNEEREDGDMITPVRTELYTYHNGGHTIFSEAAFRGRSLFFRFVELCEREQFAEELKLGDDAMQTHLTVGVEEFEEYQGEEEDDEAWLKFFEAAGMTKSQTTRL
eukprot:GDKJ01032304.1.p1 GENE.GDKJ01032304.1~~GDKJ01032304.1.p1  ORF type:complete len:419 (+),score=90.48 GDKJ01032304.1:36-1292(+)